MKLSGLFALALFAAIAVGCTVTTDSSGDYSASDIDLTTPRGTMEGSSWSMGGAVVRPDPFDDDSLSVTLLAEPVSDCSTGTSDGARVLFTVPRMEGEYPLSLGFSSDSQTVTFVPEPGSNVIAGEGLIVVKSVSDSEATIGIVAEAGDSSVNGTFTSSMCP